MKHIQVLHPLTLAFRDKALESALLESSLERTRHQGRVAIAVGIFVYLLAAILDQELVPPGYAGEVWMTRLAALCMPVFVLLLSFTRWFGRLAHPLLAAVGLAAGMGLIGIQAFLSVETSAYYYPMMVLVTFYTYNFVGTRFIYALCVDLTLLATYNALFGLTMDYPLNILASHDFFIVSANLIGGAAGYIAERQSRTLFLQERELEEANLAKGNFLAAASHDLRQPLHALNLFIEVLRHEKDPVEADRVLGNLKASALALEELLNELLDISKLEAGLFQPQIRSLELQELLEGLVRELRPVAIEKDIELGLVRTGLRVRSDPIMLTRILRNIITNAIRYTERGAVLVGCRRRGDGVAIAVYDTGPGIAPEHQRDIFREFFQVGNQERDRRQGLGLGLAIVDGLCRVLGHPLTLSSTLGRGSAFFVHLPLAPNDESSLEIVREPAIVDLAGMAVLVIDDEASVRQAMTEALGQWGCRVLTAENASEALAEMERAGLDPDAIVADYRLRNGCTGSEAISEIREALGREVPALIVTGDTAPERLQEATASGYLLLHKPIRPARLRSALTRLRELASGKAASEFETLALGPTEAFATQPG